MALQPNKGLIESRPVSPSTGEVVIKERYLVEHLIAAQASVASDHPATIWTNCTAADPCRELARLDIHNGFFTDSFADVSLIVNGAEQFHDKPNHSSYLLLRPGQYTFSSGVTSAHTPKRVDTFDVQAGHHYQDGSMWVECQGLFALFSAKEARAQVCKESRKESPIGRTNLGAVSTSWFEDARTKRVVAGQKWCANDTECPGSKCLIPAEQSRGICDIPELQCTYGERCVPR